MPLEELRRVARYLLVDERAIHSVGIATDEGHQARVGRRTSEAFGPIDKMPARTDYFPGARDLSGQGARVSVGLEHRVVLCRVDKERSADRLERLGEKPLPGSRAHDVEGLDARIFEGFACAGRWHIGDVVLERPVAIEVLLLGLLTKGSLFRRVVAATREAHARPAAERVATELSRALFRSTKETSSYRSWWRTHAIAEARRPPLGAQSIAQPG